MKNYLKPVERNKIQRDLTLKFNHSPIINDNGIVIFYNVSDKEKSKFRNIIINSGMRPSYLIKGSLNISKDMVRFLIDMDKLNSHKFEFNEEIKINDTLNPRIWNEDNTLKEDVREALLRIANKLKDNVIDSGIKIELIDIVLLGSNCNYNYSDKSDVDVHLLVDTTVYTDEDLAEACYRALTTNFNGKYELSVNDVPVELYIEKASIDSKGNIKLDNKSNGIYSLQDDKWLKEPKKEDVDFSNIDWHPTYEKYRAKAEDILSDENSTSEEVDDFLDKVWELRSKALSKEGEYSVGNFVFKELRNNDYLDELKAKKIQLESEELSL